MRLDRPIGIWLLLLPCFWGLGLGLAIHPDIGAALWSAILFTLGAIVMRGAGCAINDYWDRNIDGAVARTATRPLVTGDISPRAALLFFAFLCTIGLMVVTQMRVGVILLGILAMPLVIIYPLMKRMMPVPQVILGITFNFGVLMGYAAMTGTIGAASIWVYVGAVFWTVGYDTIYALMDRVDDQKIGLQSSVRFFGAYVVPAIALCYALATLFIFIGAAQMGLTFVLGVGIIAIAAGFVQQLRALDPDDFAGLLALFKSNAHQGAIIAATLILHGLTV